MKELTLKNKIGVPECLLGKRVRWNGKLCKIPDEISKLNTKNIVSFCPEVLAGLGVPREPIEIYGGDGFDFWEGRAHVITKNGKIIDKGIKDAALKTLKTLKENGVNEFFSVKKSPLCSNSMIYDGNFKGSLKKGKGVLTALLLINGFKVKSEFKCFL